jgi:hypothetical protein
VASTSTTAGTTLNLPNLAAGTYTVSVIPQYPATGTLKMTLVAGVGGALTPMSSGSGASYATVFGQNAYFNFSAHAGDNVSFALTNFTINPSSSGYALLYVYEPSGAELNYYYCYSSQGSCEIHLTNLPQTGTYTIAVAPGQATMNFTATFTRDATGTLTIGSRLSLSLPATGQSATLTFTLASAQTVGVGLTSLALSPAGTYLYAYVYNSSGTSVGNISTTSGSTVNLPNLAAGTYTVSISPQYPVTGSLQVALDAGVGGALTPLSSGSGSSYSTATLGQNAYFSFSANAGDNMSLALTNFSLSTGGTTSAIVYINEPNGQNLTYNYCYNSQGNCVFRLRNLPQTGSYTVSIQPGLATMSFTATLSRDATGTLTSGTPLNVSLATVGQSATLSFTTTAVKNVALTVSSISVVPSATLTITVSNSSGSTVGSATATAGATINMTSLAAGNYTVVITSQIPVSGSLQASYQ